MSSEIPHQPGSVLGTLDVQLDLPLAHVGTRGLAVLVDTVILVLAMLGLIAVFLLGGATLPEGLSQYVTVVLIWCAFLLYWGYFTLFEQFMGGQTPGKRLLGLRVVNDDGTDVGWLGSLLRNLLRIIDFVPGTYGLGVAVMLVNPRGKRVGDLAAGTIVVRERSGVMRTQQSEFSWPEGFSTADVATVEHYFRVVQTLEPAARERLAAMIVRWVRAEHPRFAEQVRADLPAAEQVAKMFTPYEGPGYDMPASSRVF